MDYSSIINSLLQNPNDPKSQQMLKNITALMSSPTGRQIISNLSKKGNADTIKIIANAAKSGDINTAKNVANSLLNSNDGEELAVEISKLFK